MDPDVSAGTPGEVLGGKEKIEIPHSGKVEPGSALRPGLTSEAHRGIKSPFGEAGDKWSPKPPGEHPSDVQETNSLLPEPQARVRERERAVEERLESPQQQLSEAAPPVLDTELAEGAPPSEQPLGLPPESCERNGSRGRSGLPPESRQRARQVTPASGSLAGPPPELTRLPPETEDRPLAGLPPELACLPPEPGNSQLAGLPPELTGLPPEPEDRQLAGLPRELTCLSQEPENSQLAGLPPELTGLPSEPEDRQLAGLPPELTRLPPGPFECPPHKEQLLGLPPEAHVHNGSWWRSGLPPEGRRRAPRMSPASWFLAGLPPELTRLPPELFFVI